MNWAEMMPSLMFMTLIAVAAIGCVMLVLFLRKRGNRHPMANQRERNIDDIRSGEPPKR